MFGLIGLSSFSTGLLFSNTFLRAPKSFLGSSIFFYIGADCLVSRSFFGSKVFFSNGFLVSVVFTPPPKTDGIAIFSILPYSIFFSTFYSTSSFTTLLNLFTYSVVLAVLGLLAPNLGLSSAGLFFSNIFLREPTSYYFVLVMLSRLTGSFLAPKGFLLTLSLVVVLSVGLASEIFFSNMAVNFDTSLPYILFKIFAI